jgi:hypothetical protein
MAILDSVDYPAIRAALDITLGTTSLPDETIEQSIFLGAAESQILQQDPQAETRTGTAREHVRNAAILLCAALIAGSMVSRVTTESLPGGGYSHGRPAVDWTKRAEELRGRSEQELAQVITPSAPKTAERPTMFTVVSGTRGR